MGKPVRKSRVTQQPEIPALRSLELAVQPGSSNSLMPSTRLTSRPNGLALSNRCAGHAGRRLCQCEAANMTGAFQYVLHRDVAERLAGAGADAARPTIGQSADAVVRRLMRRW